MYTNRSADLHHEQSTVGAEYLYFMMWTFGITSGGGVQKRWVDSLAEVTIDYSLIPPCRNKKIGKSRPLPDPALDQAMPIYSPSI